MNNHILPFLPHIEKNVSALMQQITDAQFYIRNYLAYRAETKPTIRNTNVKSINLTVHEYEILFLMFIGKSYVNIMEYLTAIYGNADTFRSFRTLRIKLMAHSDEDIMNKAISLNLVRDFPIKFLINHKKGAKHVK